MLCNKDIKRSYIKFYKSMRKYIWTYEVVELLAFFEEALFYRFPDIDKCKNMLYTLHNAVRQECCDDEILENRFVELEELLNDCDSVYSELTINFQTE